METELLGVMNFKELEAFLNSFFYDNRVSVEQLLEELIGGDFSSFLNLLKQYLFDAVTGNLSQCRGLFLGILLLGIFAIILSGMSDLFSSSQLALFSRYFVFMFVSLLLLKCFAESYENAKALLTEMEEFVGVLMPVFCIALGMANGTITAAAHYELQLLLLFLIQKLMLTILLPLVQVYCILHVMNELPEGNRFSGVLALMKKAILFATKASLFVSIGGSMLQAALLPAVDGLKNQMLVKTVSLFPGFGDYAQAISEMILRGAYLVKNSVGVVGIFLLILMCLRPVVITLMYGCVIRLVSAILQISGEKKFTAHIWNMADSFFLLARIQLFGGGLFFVSIAVATLGFLRR